MPLERAKLFSDEESHSEREKEGRTGGVAVEPRIPIRVPADTIRKASVRDANRGLRVPLFGTRDNMLG